MNNALIAKKLSEYTILTKDDEENALKEILQEIALYALSTTDFFTHAQFQGGTSLRILYGLPRFSEDLDFVLNAPNASFRWEPYVSAILESYKLYGIKPEIKDRSKTSQAIQKLFLKDDSIGKALDLQFAHHPTKKILIKLEIDINPPAGSQKENKYLSFPIDYAITAQDLPSNFAGKCHALLCRPYEKGRDWFDFSWYISQGVSLNANLLSNALKQAGPWKNPNESISHEWITAALKRKICSMNWEKTRLDVMRFLKPEQQKSLTLWSNEFFLAKLSQLKTTEP